MGKKSQVQSKVVNKVSRSKLSVLGGIVLAGSLLTPAVASAVTKVPEVKIELRKKVVKAPVKQIKKTPLMKKVAFKKGPHAKSVPEFDGKGTAAALALLGGTALLFGATRRRRALAAVKP